ncbi:hypothetical protein ACFQZX_04005 [Mucilaginibacter litoreus]|uniref:Uncharacterized protein n=1 Tax=Mucilaginibacter litoreus TaxID=1048221 RepID=A0ABW3AQZ2_9SPHI
MKKYILKPGMHQFTPGSPAIHSNDNLTDDEAEWYLQCHPHIAKLFVERPENGESERQAGGTRRKRRARRISGSFTNQ